MPGSCREPYGISRLQPEDEFRRRAWPATKQSMQPEVSGGGFGEAVAAESTRYEADPTEDESGNLHERA
jgi:hypothetical protein